MRSAVLKASRGTRVALPLCGLGNLLLGFLPGSARARRVAAFQNFYLEAGQTLIHCHPKKKADISLVIDATVSMCNANSPSVLFPPHGRSNVSGVVIVVLALNSPRRLGEALAKIPAPVLDVSQPN